MKTGPLESILRRLEGEALPNFLSAPPLSSEDPQPWEQLAVGLDQLRGVDWGAGWSASAPRVDQTGADRLQPLGRPPQIGRSLDLRPQIGVLAYDQVGDHHLSLPGLKLLL